MRLRCLVACLCLGSWTSTAFSAPPNPEQTAYEQSQLIKAQAAEDLRRAELKLRSEEKSGSYGPESRKRFFADAAAQLDRGSEARAQKYWELLGVSVPMQQPLTDLQLEQLGVLAERFKGTTRGQFALEVLEQSKTIERERQAQVHQAMARARLEKLQLNSATDLLSEEQRAGLIEIVGTYSTTPSAAVAQRLLSADDNRRTREDLVKAGLLTSENFEQLAAQRFVIVQQRFRYVKDAARLRQALADVVEDYPGTRTARQAGEQLAEVQQALNADVANSRAIRDHWDSVYPSRISSRGRMKQ